jgi:hypothetical protein
MCKDDSFKKKCVEKEKLAQLKKKNNKSKIA